MAGLGYHEEIQCVVSILDGAGTHSAKKRTIRVRDDSHFVHHLLFPSLCKGSEQLLWKPLLSSENLDRSLFEQAQVCPPP
jgi:hypothetical protein